MESKLDRATLEAARQSPPPTISPAPERASPIAGLLPARHGNTFAAFRVTPGMRAAYERAKAVADGSEWCAFLYGAPGNGKTHLAVAALLERGAGLFWRVPDFLAFLRTNLQREMVHEAQRTTEQLIAAYGKADALLVLDDLGTENATDWACEQLYRVLDGRSEYRVPTIITSNVAGDRIDQRIWSRYREGLVVCDGEDQRGRLGEL